MHWLRQPGVAGDAGAWLDSDPRRADQFAIRRPMGLLALTNGIGGDNELRDYLRSRTANSFDSCSYRIRLERSLPETPNCSKLPDSGHRRIGGSRNAGV